MSLHARLRKASDGPEMTMHSYLRVYVNFKTDLCILRWGGPMMVHIGGPCSVIGQFSSGRLGVQYFLEML